MNDVLKPAIYRYLNSQFRDFRDISPSRFPDHEFDAEESEALAQFCRRIAENGYDHIEHGLTKEVCDLLDMAAEYGCFVDAGIGEAFLGMFIVAQLLIQPYARDGFCDSMMRSEVYRLARPAVQDAARLLMLLAAYVPGKYYQSRKRQTLHLESLTETVALQIERLNLEAAFSVIFPSSLEQCDEPNGAPRRRLS